MGLIVRDCPHCGAGHTTLTCVAASVHPRDEFRQRALFSCNACFAPFAAMTHGDGDPLKTIGNLERSQIRIAYLTPSVTKPEAPQHTPQPIAKRYVEAEDSFRRQKWTSAVGMYRSTLDLATKDVATKLLPAAAGMKLFARIEALATDNIITNAMKDWAHHVRGAGNDALHDDQEMSEEDAVQMRLFTETFLQYAYELPGEVAARKGQTKASP